MNSVDQLLGVEFGGKSLHLSGRTANEFPYFRVTKTQTQFQTGTALLPIATVAPFAEPIPLT
jgi:hypothetical protein